MSIPSPFRFSSTSSTTFVSPHPSDSPRAPLLHSYRLTLQILLDLLSYVEGLDLTLQILLDFLCDIQGFEILIKVFSAYDEFF